MTETPNVLIVRFSAIGDCVMTTWAGTSIRQKYPQATLVWAAEDRCAPVIDREQLVNQLWEAQRTTWKAHRWSPSTWRSQLGYYASLRRRHFDWGIDFQGHSKTALCLKIANPTKRLAARATDAMSARMNPTLPPAPLPTHVVEWNHRALSEFGEFSLPERPVMPCRKEVATRAPRVVSFSVSAGNAAKSWPLENWKVLARRLVSEGFRVLALGGPSDPQIEVDGVENWVGKCSLGQTLSKVASSTMHVSGDTGTGHMAAALGIPTVTIFGPTDPKVYRPYSQWGTVLQNSSDTNSVSVEEVWNAVVSKGSGVASLR